MNELNSESMKKHSGFGIASFILALAIALIEFLLIVLCGVLEVIFPQVGVEDGPVEMMLGFGIIGGCVMLLVGLGLSIVGLVQKNRLKIFSILGFIFSVAFLLGVAGLLIIGFIVTN
ncbi:MAG: hypothetical protein ACYS1A_03675 [Planctomycetota bacterium]|jgi:hypothetical protein